MTRSRLLFAVLVAGLMAVTACGGASDSTTGSSSSDKGSKSLSLVAYSTPEVVYDEIEPLFQKTGDGEGVGFKSSFGASGEQSRAVEAGLKADVVSFSLEPDMDRLVKAGLVDSNWADTPSKGLVTTSLVSFIVRKGNPKGIKTWDDLLKPGVQVLTPNPFTSGAARWNLLGAYGAKSDGGKNPQAGLAYLKELITKHVKVQDKSGRDALNTFTSGTGDVLLSYEYEATTAQKKGQDVDFVTPRRHDQDREPDRRDQGRQAGGEELPRLRALQAGPGEVRQLGLPAGEPGGLRRQQVEVP